MKKISIANRGGGGGGVGVIRRHSVSIFTKEIDDSNL